MDRYGIIIIIIASMGYFAFTPTSQVYNHQFLPQPTTEYIHNPFFVGALIATYIHTAVMCDAPGHCAFNVWYQSCSDVISYSILIHTKPIAPPSTGTSLHNHFRFLQRKFITKCHPLTLTPCFKKSRITWLDLSFYDDCLPTPATMPRRALQQAVGEDLKESWRWRA